MLNSFLEKLKACGEDVSMYRDSKGCYCITFNDFEGFDDNYSEIMRDYSHPLEVETLENWLDEKCDSQKGNFYTTYHFKNFDVKVGYSSFDI